MPEYVGKGPNFYLVVCELTPPPNASKQEKIRFHREVCSKCGFYIDSFERAQKAIREKREFDKLICVHPANKATLEKWRKHIVT